MVKAIQNFSKLIKKNSSKISINLLDINIKEIENNLKSISSFYEIFNNEFSSEINKRFLDYFNYFFNSINLITPNLKEKQLIIKVEKFFNKIVNSFLLKNDLEICTLEENIFFFSLLTYYFKEKKSLDENILFSIRKELLKIFNANKDFFFLLLLEWTSKNYQFNDDVCKVDFASDSNFMKIIKFSLLNSNEFNYENTLDELNNIFHETIGEYRHNIYDLIRNAKIYINNIITTNFSENISEEEFWNNFYLIKIFQKKDTLIARSEFQIYQKLLLIYIGYSNKKNLKINIKSKISNLIQWHSNYVKNSKYHLRLTTLMDVFQLDNLSNFYIDKYMTYEFWSQSKTNDKELLEFNEILKKEKIIEWFLENLNTFIKEHYNSNKIFKEIDKINLYWKSSIYFFYKNKEYIIPTKKNVPYYRFIKYIDWELSATLLRKNFITIPDSLKKEVANKIYSCTKLNDKEIFKHIKNIYGKFLTNEELKEVDPICLLDNTYLSLIDCYQFSTYEFIGDILYKIIINSLMLDAKIYVDDQSIYSALIQEKICKSMEFSKNISIDKTLISEMHKQVSDADYFETFIYFIYKVKGFDYAKKVIYELIKENYPIILVPEVVYEEVFNDYKNLTKNKYLNEFKKEFIYIPLMDSASWISRGKPTKFIKIEKIQEEILLYCIKLNLITSDKFGCRSPNYENSLIFKDAYNENLHSTASFYLQQVFGDIYNLNKINEGTLANLIYDFNTNFDDFNLKLIKILEIYTNKK